MNDLVHLKQPPQLDAILKETAQIGFRFACEAKTGSLLRTLAASKPGGKLLEIGTGTGVGASWILAGMDARSRLTTVEMDAQVNAVARKFLGDDPRLTILTRDAEEFLRTEPPDQYDFIFADTFPGKLYMRDEAITLLKVGGLYIVDDLLPQDTWPENHSETVVKFLAEMEADSRLTLTRLNWASGLIIATKIRS